MQAVRIIRSQVEARGLVVKWSDGVLYIFDPRRIADYRIVQSIHRMTDREEHRRLAVSRTAGEATLRGCGVAA